MPWETRRRNGQFQTVKKGTNKVVGTHSSQEDADKHVRALYANYHGPKSGEKKDYSGAVTRRRSSAKLPRSTGY